MILVNCQGFMQAISLLHRVWTKLQPRKMWRVWAGSMWMPSGRLLSMRISQGVYSGVVHQHLFRELLRRPSRWREREREREWTRKKEFGPAVNNCSENVKLHCVTVKCTFFKVANLETLHCLGEEQPDQNRGPSTNGQKRYICMYVFVATHGMGTASLRKWSFYHLLAHLRLPCCSYHHSLYDVLCLHF